MALGSEYCKQIRQELRRHANFPPNRPIALGDYGVIKDDIFERLGNIGQLGLRFAVIDGTGQSTFQFKSKGNVSFELIARGDVGAGGVPAVRAGLELKFARENSVLFAAAGCTVKAIDDLRTLESALLQLLDQGRWETDFYVVTEINHASKTTAIASGDRDCEIKLEADSPALEAIHLADATLSLHVKRSRNTALEIVTESDQIPLMQLARLRGVFNPVLRTESLAAGGGRSRFRLTSDDETGSAALSAATRTPAAESVAFGHAEPEIPASLEGVEAVRTDFELQRAIRAYIPIMKASYDFAHGNENPPLPAGYEILARIRTRREELPAAAVTAEVESEEARESVANDFRALAQEARRGIPAGRPQPEGIASPDAFGFVLREAESGSIIVSIRGTQTPEEWVKNFTAIPNPFTAVPGFGAVHLGFEQMWGRIRGPVMDALANEPADTRITFLGHSLGGAMATLGAVDVKRNLNRPNVDLCTFGSPRVGQLRFRSNFNGLIERAFRIAEGRDIVPHVPPLFLIWSHVGLQIGVRSRVDNPHSLDSYLEGLQNLVPRTESVGGGEVLAMALP
jgi:triacylglycerol lipase